MSAYRFWTLTCDECGEVFDEGIQMTAKECRTSAKKRGWSTGVGKHREDYCPYCKENLAE